MLDVRDASAINERAREIGTLEVLVNCAGFVHHGTILDCSEQDWTYSFGLNVTSMFHTCRAFLPTMLEAGKGSIVNIASVVSTIKATPNRFIYATTKAAVIGLTKAIAADFIGRGIRCNGICPGTVLSPSLEQRISAQENPQNGVCRICSPSADAPAGPSGRNRRTCYLLSQ